jgi:LysM repeat protein
LNAQWSEKTGLEMEKKNERWGITIVAFFVIVGIFSFLLLKGGKTVVSDELVLAGPHDKSPHGGVLYNYHPIRAQALKTATPWDEPEATERTEGGDEPSGTRRGGGPGFIYHKVQSGDSLWKIARKYNAEIGDIVKDNSIRDPNVIYAGATLKITPKHS